MPSLSETSPLTIPALVAAKGGEKIAMLTAYDAPSAALLDAAGVDGLLGGDSVEMAVYGEPSTLTATMDSMIRHSKPVSRAVKRADVGGAMPFLSSQTDPHRAGEDPGRVRAAGGRAAGKDG